MIWTIRPAYSCVIDWRAMSSGTARRSACPHEDRKERKAVWRDPVGRNPLGLNAVSVRGESASRGYCWSLPRGPWEACRGYPPRPAGVSRMACHALRGHRRRLTGIGQALQSRRRAASGRSPCTGSDRSGNRPEPLPFFSTNLGIGNQGRNLAERRRVPGDIEHLGHPYWSTDVPALAGAPFDPLRHSPDIRTGVRMFRP